MLEAALHGIIKQGNPLKTPIPAPLQARVKAPAQDM